MKQIKNIKKLAKLISKKEGLKKQVNIAQISEILGVLSDLVYESMDGRIEWIFLNNGQKRAEKENDRHKEGKEVKKRGRRAS